MKIILLFFPQISSTSSNRPKSLFSAILLAFFFSTGKSMTLGQFKKIFDQYYTPIKNFLYYKCGDIALAEDLTQDVFMKAWDKREDIQQETVKSYLYTIANNMLLNKLRHNKVVMNFAEKHKDQHNEQSPQYALEEQEFKKELETTIGNMPEKQREVFLMNRIEELTYKEIADRLGLSVKAVEKRMHGALGYLKEKIKYKI